MGRPAEGWRLRAKGPARTLFVRFRHEGRRYDLTTSTSDPVEAGQAAARIYAETVSGRVTPQVSGDLRELVRAWLVDYSAGHAAGTVDTVADYARTWLAHFGAVSRLTEPSFADYSRSRIRRVTRSTLRKELSALRQFVAWGVEHGVWGHGPVVPSLPKAGHPGVRAANARKRIATILTPAEVKRLIAALPVRSKRGWHVRAFFTVLYETGLRESTLYGLEVPLHYRKGASELFVTREIDKAHNERRLPLTDAARKALDLVAPKSGRMFIERDWRPALAKAVVAAQISKSVSRYDLRHSRASHIANTPGAPLAGLQYLLGHRHLSTTARYVQGQQESAALALRAVRRGKSSGP